MLDLGAPTNDFRIGLVKAIKRCLPSSVILKTMKSICFAFLASVSSLCFTRRQCLATALDSFKDSYQITACAAVQNDANPVGEWSFNVVKVGMYEFRVFCADRQDCKGCSIELDSDFFSKYGYDTKAFARQGNTLMVIPAQKN
ncbi:hypothetical protein DSO57_1038888 [Entomophthora muscae]|uniref:Uncharacterized protein n=1 Tax=Entomophthora muscae TaxID=34485 RepID=A0ACC2TKT0_9FUNG|nr:hypothetical protein DSO57_1038888 [Entomophthora muscae]